MGCRDFYTKVKKASSMGGGGGGKDKDPLECLLLFRPRRANILERFTLGKLRFTGYINKSQCSQFQNLLGKL